MIKCSDLVLFKCTKYNLPRGTKYVCMSPFKNHYHAKILSFVNIFGALVIFFQYYRHVAISMVFQMTACKGVF